MDELTLKQVGHSQRFIWSAEGVFKITHLYQEGPDPSFWRVTNLAGSFEYTVEELTLKQVGHSKHFVWSILVVFKISYLYQRGSKSFCNM